MSSVDDDKTEAIRTRAYEIWVEEGRPEGREWDHWTQAVRELGYDGTPPVDAESAPDNPELDPDLPGSPGTASGGLNDPAGSSGTPGRRKSGGI